MFRIDGPGATEDSKFTGGNASTGTPATRITSDWLNAVQEEIVAVLTAAGIDPNKANNGQLVAAIAALIAGGGDPITAAAVTVADTLGLFTSDNVEAALAQLAAKLYNGTINANQVRRSIVPLVVSSNMDSTHVENIVKLTNAAALNYTIVADGTAGYTAPTACEIVLWQGGAGQVTVVAGGGVTLVYPNTVFLPKTLAQNANIVLIRVAANTWLVGGMLAAA